MDILDGLPPPPNPPTMNAKKQNQIIRSFSNDNSSYRFNAKTPPLTPSKKKNYKLVNVKIILLDDTVTVLQVQIKTIGRIIFDQICKQLNIIECDYFGLEYVDSSGTYHYIDFEKKLNHQVGLNINEPVLKFVIKFYTPDPLQLEEEFTRYLFSLQIRRDLATGLLQCNDNTAALMASYLVQAECGDFSEDDYPDASYLNKHLFVPNQDYEIENRIRENHKKHVGQSPAEADLHLLEVARRTEFYGIKLHPAKDDDSVVLNLSVSHLGILIFHGNTKINIFSWSKIRKISFKRKRFLLKLHPEGYGYYKETIDFIFEGRNECKTFWKRCVEHHSFFRCDKAPIPSTSSRSKSLLNSRGSSFRYSGRTQKQMVSFVRENFIKRSITPTSMKNASPNMHQRVIPSSFQRSSSFRSNAEAAQSGVSTSCSSPAMIISSNDRIIEINNSKHDSDSQPEDTISPGTSINSSPQHNVPLYYHHHEGIQFPQQQQGQIYNSAQSITSYTYENEFPITTYKSTNEELMNKSKKKRSKSLINKKSTDTIASSTKECHDTTSHGSYDLLESNNQYEFNEFVPYLLRRRIDLEPNHQKLYKSKSFSNTINKKKIKLAKYLSYNSIGYYYSWQDDTYDFEDSFDNPDEGAVGGSLPSKNANLEFNLHESDTVKRKHTSGGSSGGGGIGGVRIVDETNIHAGQGGPTQDPYYSEDEQKPEEEVYELSEEGCKAEEFELSEEGNENEDELELTEEAKPPEVFDSPFGEEQFPDGEDPDEDLTEEIKEEPFSKSDEENNDDQSDRSMEEDDRFNDEVPEIFNESADEVPADILDDVPEDVSKSDEIYEQESYKSDEVEEDFFDPNDNDDEPLVEAEEEKPELFPKPETFPKPQMLREETFCKSDEITDEELVMYEEDNDENSDEFEKPDGVKQEEIIYETLKVDVSKSALGEEPDIVADEAHIYEALVEMPENNFEPAIPEEFADSDDFEVVDVPAPLDYRTDVPSMEPDLLKEVIKKSVTFDVSEEEVSAHGDEEVESSHGDEPEEYPEQDFPDNFEQIGRAGDNFRKEEEFPNQQFNIKVDNPAAEEAEEPDELEEKIDAIPEIQLDGLEPPEEDETGSGPGTRLDTTPVRGHKQVMFFIEDDEDSDTNTIESEKIRLSDFNKMKLLLNQLENLKEVQKSGEMSDDYPGSRTILPEILEDEDSIELTEPTETPTETLEGSTATAQMVDPTKEGKLDESAIPSSKPSEPLPCSSIKDECLPGSSKMSEYLQGGCGSKLLTRSESSSDDDGTGGTPLEPIPEVQEPPLKVLYFENKCLPERSFPTKQLETLLEEESPDMPAQSNVFAPVLRKSSTPSLDELPLPPTPPVYEMDEDCETPKYPPPSASDVNNRRFSFNKSRSSTDSSEQRKRLSRTFSIESDEVPALPVRTTSSNANLKSTSSTEPKDSESDNSSSEHSPDVTNITTNLFINFPNHRTLSRISERTHSSEEVSDTSSNFVKISSYNLVQKNRSDVKYDDDDVSGLTINTVPLVTLTSELCDSSATLNDFDEIEEEVREGNVELHRAYLNLNVVNGEIQF